MPTRIGIPTHSHTHSLAHSLTLSLSNAIGATEGYSCRVIREDTNNRKLYDRVDEARTCDDTMPTWESLDYSQRFVTKSCMDTITPDVKDGDSGGKVV